MASDEDKPGTINWVLVAITLFIVFATILGLVMFLKLRDQYKFVGFGIGYERP